MTEHHRGISLDDELPPDLLSSPAAEPTRKADLFASLARLADKIQADKMQLLVASMQAAGISPEQFAQLAATPVPVPPPLACSQCGEAKPDVVIRADPYQSEINDDHTERPLCDACYDVSLDEI
jgi:hypothetical protein